MRSTGRLLTVLVVLTALSGCSWIERTSRASRPANTQGNGASGALSFPLSGPSVSQSGRYVAFSSDASNLVPGDTNGVADIFVRDHVTGSTERVSIGVAGHDQADMASNDASISDDGRFVAFATTIAFFTSPPSLGVGSRIFLRDRQLGTTTEVFGGTGTPALPTISGNGKVVAFVGGDIGATYYERTATPPFAFNVATQTWKTMPLPDSIDSSFFFDGSRPSLSDDGSRIAYSYVVRPTGSFDSATIVTVVADTTTGAIIATVRTAEIFKAHQTQRLESVISGDGTQVYVILAEGVIGTLYRYDFAHPGLEPIVTDISRPQNLRVADDGNVIGFRRDDSFVITDASGAPPRVVSADILGNPVTSLLGNVDLSGDGKWIAFASTDPDLVADDTNGVSDVFVRANGFELVPPS